MHTFHTNRKKSGTLTLKGGKGGETGEQENGSRERTDDEEGAA